MHLTPVVRFLFPSNVFNLSAFYTLKGNIFVYIFKNEKVPMIFFQQNIFLILYLLVCIICTNIWTLKAQELYYYSRHGVKSAFYGSTVGLFIKYMQFHKPYLTAEVIVWHGVYHNYWFLYVFVEVCVQSWMLQLETLQTWVVIWSCWSKWGH